MTQSELGKLEEITDLRSVWPHEATDFTPWLAEHIELLEKTVDSRRNRSPNRRFFYRYTGSGNRDRT